jgi:hypothetical protein
MTINCVEVLLGLSSKWCLSKSFGGTCVMKTVSRKKKPLSLDAVLASVEIEMAQIVAAIAAERRSSLPTPRRARVPHPKGHAHAA